jgi:hypothetical protein
MNRKGGGLQIGILIGVYVVVQFTSTFFRHNGMAGAGGALMFVWLGFCLYTWIGPAIFQRQLRKELEKIRLQPDF